MKTKNKITFIGKIPVTTRTHSQRPTEVKAVVVSAWAPQPSSMTREEIRKQVIDQIG